METKRPYISPHSEMIAVHASKAILTASSEGFPVTPVAPFNVSVRPPDDFDFFTDFNSLAEHSLVFNGAFHAESLKTRSGAIDGGTS
jgi:hypothetical protein